MQVQKFIMRLDIGIVLLSAAFCLLLIFIGACGRRGDPVAIVPREEKNIEKELNKNNNKDEDISETRKKGKETPEMKVNSPDSPTGLTAIYTQQSIILTWDEITGQEIRFYRIYRSEGNDYIHVGDTVIPAFSDKNIKSNIKYYYKISAVGASESPSSKEIEIVTTIK